jgi:hypothetical protein
LSGPEFIELCQYVIDGVTSAHSLAAHRQKAEAAAIKRGSIIVSRNGESHSRTASATSSPITHRLSQTGNGNGVMQSPDRNHGTHASAPNTPAATTTKSQLDGSMQSHDQTVVAAAAAVVMAVASTSHHTSSGGHGTPHHQHQHQRHRKNSSSSPGAHPSDGVVQVMTQVARFAPDRAGAQVKDRAIAVASAHMSHQPVPLLVQQSSSLNSPSMTPAASTLSLSTVGSQSMIVNASSSTHYRKTSNRPVPVTPSRAIPTDATPAGDGSSSGDADHLYTNCDDCLKLLGCKKSRNGKSLTLSRREKKKIAKRLIDLIIAIHIILIAGFECTSPARRADPAKNVWYAFHCLQSMSSL